MTDSNKAERGHVNVSVHATADMIRVAIDPGFGFRALEVVGPGECRIVSIFVVDRETAEAIRDAAIELMASFPEPEQDHSVDPGPIETVLVETGER